MTTKCIVCLKSVFQMELVRDERGPYHDKCYKCTHCKTKLQFGKYSEIEGKLYCVLHTPSSLTPPIRQEPQVELVFTSTPTPTIAPPQRTTMPPPQPTPQPLVNISPILPIPPRQKRLPPLPAAKYPDLNFPFEFSSRWLALVGVDRPLYNKGDLMFITVTLMDGLTYRACPTPFAGIDVKIMNGRDEVIEQLRSGPIFNSAFGLKWRIADLPGGDYKVRVDGNATITSGERTFEIREFTMPRFKKQIEFLKKGLGLGDTAQAKLEVHTSEGDIPKQATVTATARIDGEEVWKDDLSLGEDGTCLITFTIPKELARGEGTLSCTIDDGGSTETIGKTIPIFLRTINLTATTESGDPVIGLTSSLYFTCKTTSGDPADMSGELISCDHFDDDALEKPLDMIDAANITYEAGAKFRFVSNMLTLHEGRGRVDLTPAAGQQYFVRVLKPSGIRYLIPLIMEIKKEGALVTFPSVCVGKPNDTFLNVQVQSTQPGKYSVALYKKHQQLCVTQVVVKEAFQKQTVPITVPTFGGDGVLRVTLFSANGRHLSERLLFQYPRTYLKMNVKANHRQYAPRENVELTITVSDRFDKPVAAYVNMSVVDDSVLESIERRKKEPRLREMALLETEVEEFFDSAVYLRGDEKGHVATDLLLGTQGWRRFKYFDTEEQLKKFIEDNKDKVHIERLGSFDPFDSSPVLRGKQRYRDDSTGSESDEDEYDLVSLHKNERRKGKGGPALPLKMLRKQSSESEGLSLDYQVAPCVSRPAQSPQPQKSGGAGKPSQKDRALSSPRSMVRNGAPTPSKRGGSVPSPSAPSTPPTTLGIASSFSMPRARCGDKSEGRPSAPLVSRAPPIGRQSLKEDIECDSSSKKKKRYVGKVHKPRKLMPAKIQKTYGVRLFGFRTKNRRDHASSNSSGSEDEEPETEDYTRNQFCETIFFAAGLLVQGERVIRFDLPDNITSFKARIDGFNNKDLFGACDLLIKSVEPLAIEPKLPKDVSVGDTIVSPLVIMNNTSYELTDVTSEALVCGESAFTEENIYVAANSRTRRLLTIPIGPSRSLIPINVSAASLASKLNDSVARSVKVYSLGFPRYFYQSMCLTEQEPELKWDISVPEYVEGSMHCNVSFSCNNGQSMLDTMQQMLKRPHGCFEQAGATLFPSIFALRYFQGTPGSSSVALKQGERFIEEGYALLSKYESKTGGFEWYGGNPGHEALTAYGLLLLQQLTHVYDKVDMALVKRTRAWLLSRRDGNGRFQQSIGRYAFSQPDKAIANAYILWALTNQSEKEDHLEKEIDQAILTGSLSSDPYLHGLTALVCMNVGRKEDAAKFVKKIDLQYYSGSILNGRDTICRTYGEGINTQTTALAVIVFSKFDRAAYQTKNDALIKTLLRKKWGNGWDCSQSNTMCLWALFEFYEGSIVPDAQPKATLHIDDYSEEKAIGAMPSITFQDISPKLTAGDHKVSFVASDIKGRQGQLSISVAYHTLLPHNDENCRVSLECGFANKVTSLVEGESTEVNVVVKNISDDHLPMVIAEIALPGGIVPRYEKLKELVKEEKIDYYEIFGSRNLVFYWRGMNDKDVFSFSFDVVANIPGTYSANASSVYLYYTPAWQWYVPGLSIKIEPKKFKAIARAPVVEDVTEQNSSAATTIEEKPVANVEESGTQAVETPVDPEPEPEPLDYYSNGSSINEFYGGVDLASVYGTNAGFEVPVEAQDDLAAFYGGASRTVSFDFII